MSLEARLDLVRWACVAGLGLVGLRAMQLAVLPSESTLDRAAIQRWASVDEEARRGTIVDRSGHRLATSVVTPHVVVDPERIPAKAVPTLSHRLAEILERPANDVAADLMAPGQYRRLATHVHPAVAEAVAELRAPGVWVEHARSRHYPDEDLASHVLGFVDAAGIGRLGIEATMQTYLQGGRVRRGRRRNSQGDEVSDPRSPDDAFAGMTVQLTLDRAVQRLTEEAIDEAVSRDVPLAASAVVVDVETGDILAMASWPDFDPNQLDNDPAPRRNRAVEAAYEPGSVLKPFTLATALEVGAVTLDTMIDVERGAWRFGGAVLHDVHPFRRLTAGQVVVQSSNIGASKLAVRVGAERFVTGLRSFGFGSVTGIGLPAERSGIVRDAAAIRPIELATTSFGQGMTATTLQLAMATAALGNDGVRMKPRLVERIEDVHGIPEWTSRPEAVARVVSPGVADAVVRTMTQVTAPNGPAPRGGIEGHAVAGKTGTAQKPADGGYGDEHVSSFIALAPADDPILAVAVIVDAPSQGRISGASVAAPVASQILARGLRHVGGGGRGTIALAASPAPAPKTFVPQAPSSATVVPDLSDHTLREALSALQHVDLSWSVRGSGRVVRQVPAPGTLLRAGDPITLVLR